MFWRTLLFTSFIIVNKEEVKVQTRLSEFDFKRRMFMDSPLLSKSKQFALDIIKICNKVKSEKRESVLTNQLIRSGTSIGANIREAFYGHGKNDFIAKLQIALKECAESEYWIELLVESGYYDDKIILENCIELKKILVSSINTAKKNNN